MIPLLQDLHPNGLEYPGNYLVEFEPDSIWYETSLTVAAQALKHGIGTEYHTFQHMPAEVRMHLKRQGLDLEELERKGIFRLLDTYTSITGLPLQGEAHELYGVTGELQKPTYLEDLAAGIAKMIREGCPDHAKRWLHVDDNTSVFSQHFDEDEVLHVMQNRILPYMRVRESIALHSVAMGVGSPSFYKRFESHCDGIIDLRGQEEAGQIEQHIRVRSIKGRACDTRWRRLRLLENGEVNVDPWPVEEKVEAKGLGLGAWLRGPKKK